MSQNKTKYLRKKVLDHFLGRVSYSFPTNVYLGLFKANPTDAGTQTNEVSGGSYARVEISDLLGDADLPTGLITNAADIAFPTATSDWQEITHLGILDAASAGNMLYYGPAVTTRVVENGDTFTIKAGQLTVQEQ